MNIDNNINNFLVNNENLIINNVEYNYKTDITILEKVIDEIIIIIRTSNNNIKIVDKLINLSDKFNVELQNILNIFEYITIEYYKKYKYINNYIHDKYPDYLYYVYLTPKKSLDIKLFKKSPTINDLYFSIELQDYLIIHTVNTILSLSREEAIDKYITYFIKKKNDELIKIFDNSSTHKEQILKYLKSYLYFLPEYILIKFLNEIEIKDDIVFPYYLQHKLNNKNPNLFGNKYSKEKYIPFKTLTISKGQILYTITHLYNNKFINIQNNNKVKHLLKFVKLLNKLPFDMQMEICNLRNINLNDIMKCIIYLELF